MSTLTPRMEAVLVGIALGYSIGEIARRLGLSERTIAYSVASVKRHFGDAVLSQAAVVTRAYAEGVLRPGATLSEDGRVQYSVRSVTRRSMGLRT